jgi:hypothetical protein
MRRVDEVNRHRLRVLQVAFEETWAVAKILEENQYKCDEEPDLVLARKEAEKCRKRKKEEEEEKAVSESSSESSLDDDQ